MTSTTIRRNLFGSQILFPVKYAHQKKYVSYKSDGTALFKYKKINAVIPPSGQHSLIMAMYQDLSKALSQVSNSPVLENGRSLRQNFDHEFEKYVNLLDLDLKDNYLEPNYGNYFFDSYRNRLFIIPPEKYHRLALVTNNAKLLTDKKNKMSWNDMRGIFDNVVIGFLGASVGGNIFEGVMREIRPKSVKIADPDWIEATNLNRLERGNLEYLVESKAHREDIRNHFDIPRVNKAEHAAYQQSLIDPYMKSFIYSEGVHTDNIEQFLIGNKDEPKVNIIVEEVDDFRIKVDVRKMCKKHKIPLLMISDFGHTIQCQFHDFRSKNIRMGYGITDKKLQQITDVAMSKGSRESRFDLVEALCGDTFRKGDFGKWVRGEGEQPTSSIPQSGATAMIAGGIGAKTIVRYILGYAISDNAVFNSFTFTDPKINKLK